MSDLKPCPFCGCEISWKVDEASGDLRPWHGPGEDCLGRDLLFYTRPKTTKEGFDIFTMLWNRRNGTYASTMERNTPSKVEHIPASPNELGFMPIVWDEHDRDYPQIETRIDRFGRTRYRAVIYLNPLNSWDAYSARAGSMEDLVRKWNRKAVRWQRRLDGRWGPLE